MADHPNVLFILLDCLRSRAVFDPEDGAKTPTIDALIDRGAGFSTCVATATTTSPSMATIFTGTLPFVHGVRSLHGFKLEPGVSTIAEILRDAGYATYAEATGPVMPQKGFDRGFDSFVQRGRKETLYRTAVWERLVGEIEDLPTDRPWFFYLHLWELHRPRAVPRAFDKRAYGVRRYERALSALDMSKLSEILAIVGPDTLVILTGDHGEIPRYDRIFWLTKRLRLRSVNRYFDLRSGHGHQVIEDLVLVPLVLAGSGVRTVGRLDTAVRHMDLFPTILELTAVGDPRGKQAGGMSLIPVIEGDNRGDRPGYAEAVGAKMRGPENWLVSIRHEGWKLVRRPVGDERWLWRLPDESGNIASAHPDVVARMEALLSELQAGRALDATGGDLSAQESEEIAAHLRDLGYLD